MLKILCVEDDYIASYMLHERIERMGYFIIDKVSTGEDALKLCEWQQPDVILMDIRLSGEIDGIEAARRIGEEHGVPIIFITGISDTGIQRRAKELKPHGFFTKPFEITELQQSIDMIFRTRKRGQPV